MSRFQVVDLPTFSDARGALTVMENALPFAVARAFWITNADGQTRGGHRHHKTRQALVALTGSVAVYMNDGAESETVLLDSPARCLLVEPQHWHTMTFGPGAALLVFASHAYDAADYIHEPYA